MTEAFLNSMGTAVDKFAQSVGSFANQQGLEIPPKAGSLGFREMEQILLTPNDETFATICSQAWVKIEAAGDYLFAIPRLLTEPAMSIAPFACARGVLESSAEVLWLLDKSIDVEDRVGRSLALRYREQVEHHKFSAAWDDPKQGAHAESRMAHIVGAATLRNLEVRRDKRGTPIGVGPVIPSKTALARDYLSSESDYRLLSAVTHSQGSFLLSSSFTRSPKPGFVVKAMDAKMAMYLLYRAATWFARSVWVYFSYVGWNNRELLRLLEASFDAIGLTDKERFWRDELTRP